MKIDKPHHTFYKELRDGFIDNLSSPVERRQEEQSPVRWYVAESILNYLS